MSVPAVLDFGRPPSFASHHAGIPRRPAARQQGDALPRGPADGRRDRRRYAPRRRGRHGWRLRAMIVMLWRGGLRIQEALTLAEHDLDPRRGSLLVRNGKGGRRREVGIDEWGWEQLRPPGPPAADQSVVSFARHAADRGRSVHAAYLSSRPVSTARTSCPA
jgi:Phage integrase family